jgi:hypothetical protein
MKPSHQETKLLPVGRRVHDTSTRDIWRIALKSSEQQAPKQTAEADQNPVTASCPSILYSIRNISLIDPNDDTRQARRQRR